MYISFICQMKVFSVKYIQMITLFKHRFFEVWKEWAQRKAQLRRDSQEFSNQRIQSWVKMDAIYFHDKNEVQLKLIVVTAIIILQTIVWFAGFPNLENPPATNDGHWTKGQGHSGPKHATVDTELALLGKRYCSFVFWHNALALHCSFILLQ